MLETLVRMEQTVTDGPYNFEDWGTCTAGHMVAAIKDQRPQRASCAYVEYQCTGVVGKEAIAVANALVDAADLPRRVRLLGDIEHADNPRRALHVVSSLCFRASKEWEVSPRNATLTILHFAIQKEQARIAARMHNPIIAGWHAVRNLVGK